MLLDYTTLKTNILFLMVNQMSFNLIKIEIFNIML